MKKLIAFLFISLAGMLPAFAQETAWVQIEAHRTLREAQDRARAYSSAFPDVNGFQQAGGWYAIALGPFTPEGALNRLRDLRAERLIPNDSYISDGAIFRQQFWPVGANTLAAPAVIAPAAPQPQATEQAAMPQPVIEEPEETRAQAQRSERDLTRDERMALQEALQWEGFYTSAIDGAFGRGTRASMAAWQEDKGLEPTGVLTTRQRAKLLGDYRDTFAALGMQSVVESEAGITIDIPTGMVDFARYEAPFVHYDSKGDSGVRVLLISQSGDQDTLFGLYDIMQTLEIVPMEGERERKNNSFVLTGQGAKLHSYTYAALSGGHVKGFTLIWQPKDDKLMTRVTQMMRDSFKPQPDSVLPDTAGDPNAPQSLDLLSGLDIRRPALSRSGFYVDGAGTVVTTTEVLAQCTRLTIDDIYEAEIAAQDDTLGLAVLRPKESLAPMAHAAFQTAQPRLKSDVAVAGYSYGGVLDLPVLTYGTLADMKGLAGETNLQRLALAALPGDAGGPVFDVTGSVMGVLLPRAEDGGRQLPQDVSFATSVPALADFLSAHGVTMDAADGALPISAEDLSQKAMDMTVLVSCWQ